MPLPRRIQFECIIRRVYKIQQCTHRQLAEQTCSSLWGSHCNAKHTGGGTQEPLGSKNVLDRRNEEEESSSSEIQDMKQREGMLSVRTPRMPCLRFVYILVCLLMFSLGLGLGCLEIHLRNRNGKHI